MSDESDGIAIPVLPPTPMPFDLFAELSAFHEQRMRRLDRARAERAAFQQARAAGLVKRHAAKQERIRQQRALAEALGLSIADPDQDIPHDGCEEHQ